MYSIFYSSCLSFAFRFRNKTCKTLLILIATISTAIASNNGILSNNFRAEYSWRCCKFTFFLTWLYKLSTYSRKANICLIFKWYASFASRMMSLSNEKSRTYHWFKLKQCLYVWNFISNIAIIEIGWRTQKLLKTINPLAHISSSPA